ncbi:MAG TPA: DNA repair protein RadC [Usitatibacter sp.]|jgi:DNA repair protein RadC|nr:DNA repair protein RadC [Usitatibacter sp.]
MNADSRDVKHWSDAALLAALLGPRKARAIYAGKLQPLFGGTNADEKLAAAREIVTRWLNEELGAKDALASPGSVRSFLRLQLGGKEHECFGALFLDAQNKLIAYEELFRGTLTQTSVYPREVVKTALRHNAAALVLAHNHPSGVAEPSLQDQALTRTLAEALALIDVKVLDHFIVAGATALSFAERGLL